MAKEVQITNGRGVVLVDDADCEFVSKYKWYLSARGYAVANSPMVNGKRGKSIYMHRLIMDAKSGQDVDHINHQPLDNTRHNLRLCSRSQNSANSTRPSRNTSGFKGVSWNKRDKRWRAQIGIGYQLKHLGCFSTPEDAALAYDVAAIEIFGEFALVNFPLRN